ncbi:MAG: hypothetical protein ACJAZA_000753 [Shewanella psychromarinicola]|jgi:hypothetical protein
MKIKTLILTATLFLAATLSCNVFAANQPAAFEPTVNQLHAYKAYHHAEYLKETAKQAGGTNRLLHTRELPTEGADPVVTPSLDHLYTKAVIDLTNGPVYLYMPKVEGRYFSMEIHDQEHYATYYKLRPSGLFVFVNHTDKTEFPADVTVIKDQGYYPHLFIRTQLFNADDLPTNHAIQDKIRLTGAVGTIAYKNAIAWTLATHDMYPQNAQVLDDQLGYNAETHVRMFKYISDYSVTVKSSAGMFEAIDDPAGSNDPKVRASAIIGHLGLPISIAVYGSSFADCDGKALNGSKDFTITQSYKPEVSEFWSITRYSGLQVTTTSLTHTTPSPMHRATLQ